MLSVSTVKSAGGAAGYYTAEDNYYFLGEQSTEWYGTGAESLGLEGAVGKNAFTNVLEGLLPDGTDMRRMEGEVNKHRPGYDLTFSAPKSVSVLALVTGDTFLIEAHQRAVRRTLDEVEKIASTRTMTDGISEIEMTGNLLAAVFMHDTSRNLDPNLHSHAVVANTTLSQGGWKTLSTDIKGQNSFTDIVWNQQVSIGAIYRGFLRQDVEEHGYPTTDTGSRGEWDITGVPVKPFSSRREQILDAVGGEATAKQKSVAALDTRQAKQFTEMESVREHWKETLAETGFDADAFRAEVKNRGEQKADNQRDQPERSPSSPVQRDGIDPSKSSANTPLPDSDKIKEKEATEQRDNAGETIKPRENEPADVVQERREHDPQKPAHAPEKAVPPHATDTGKSVTPSPESPALPGAEDKGQSPAVAEPVQSDPASTPPEAKQHKAPLQEGKPVTPEPEIPAPQGTKAHGQSPAVAESVQPGPAITPPESKQHEASLQEGKPVTPEPENPALPGEENTSPRLEQAVPEAGNNAPEKARAVDAPAMQVAVTQAIDRLSDKGVRFTWDDVMTSVINHSRVEPGIYGNIRAGIEQAVERGQLIAVDKNQTLFTSSAHIRDEARLSQVAESLAARPGGLSAPDTSTGALAQVALANTAISLVDLRGGTAFAAEFSRNVHALAEHNNRPLVVVAADTASLKRQSQVLGNPAGVQTSTPEGLREQGIPAGALVYISESERLNTTALHDVLKEASLQGATTIVTDTRARRSTGFGAEVLRTAGVKDFTASPATENVRVTMVQKETVEDRLTVAARYYAQEKSHGNEVRLQAGNERTRDKLTSRTREALQEEGGLGQVLGEINVRIPVWLDASNRNDRSRYREGQILEHHPAQGKATTFSIAGINTRYNTLTLTDEKGQLTGMKISDIDSHWRLFREKKIEVREGEQLRMTADAGPAAKRGDTVTVTGVKEGSWLFKDRLVMKNSDGVAFKVDKNAPVYADYGYTESFGASRRGSGSVIAVLAGKEVDDTTLNLLRRSGGNVVAFTPLDEATINKRLEANRPSITVTQGVKSQAGKEDLAEALRELGTRKMNYPERVTRIAVEKATGIKVTFDRLEVIGAAISAAPRLSPDRVSTELQRLEEKGEVVLLGKGQQMAGHYISRENLENEKTILRVVAAGKNSVDPLISEGLSAADSAPLTNGQRQAANLILTSRDQVIAISGHAGVGKTTQFRTVATSIAALNGEVEIAGLAPTHRAVSELQHAGIPSQTIASFLNEQSTYQQAGEARDFSKKVFIIDESSMSGNAQKAQLLTSITEAGGRIVLSGDRDQLKSLESGMPFGLVLDRSAAEVAAMTEIVRQTPALKPAIEAIIAGDVRGSLEVANSLSPEIVPRAEGAWRPEKSVVNFGGEGGDIHGMIAQDYANRTAEARDGTMILTELNKDRELVNEAVHNQLSGQGVVSDSVTVPVLVRVNNSNADLGRERFWVAQKGNTAQLGERYFTIGDTDAESGVVNLTGLDGASDRWISPAELRKESAAVFVPKEREMGIGEKVRLTATNRERNISANDSAVVTGITAQGQLELDAEGKSITLDPNAAMADRHVDYGYAVTTYSAQGASVRYMIGLVGVESGRKNMAAQDSTYVQISRAKEHVQLYGDNVEKWIKAVENRSGRRQTVHDMVMHAEDIRAGREAGLWDKSQPVSETRIAERMDQHVIADARFVSGKSPELLWPVVNSHGRHRGNLHVPVTPATGHLDFSSAHYEGANDGNRVVMQRGERHGKVLEAADVDTALQLIAENPGSPVVVITDHSERGEAGAAAASERAETASGEELTRNEDEALDKALETSREKEPDQPEAADEKADPQADGEEAEWEGYGLDDEDALQQTSDYLAAYDMDNGRQAEPAQRPLDENVNQVRSPTTQPDHDFVRQPQKTLE